MKILFPMVLYFLGFVFLCDVKLFGQKIEMLRQEVTPLSHKLFDDAEVAVKTESYTDSIYHVEDGLKHLIVKYYENGYKRKVISYYSNNTVHRVLNFNEHGLHGLNKVYYKNGNLKSKSQYKDGVSVGVYLHYYKHGAISAIIMMNDSSQLLSNLTFFENGKLSTRTARYGSGKNKVLFEAFYENGNTAIQYKMGGKEKYYEFYEDGSLEVEGEIYIFHYARVGSWKEYYHKGDLRSKFHYLQITDSNQTPNVKTGIWKWWNEDGQLIREEQYKDGKLLETKVFIESKDYKGIGVTVEELTLSGKEYSLDLVYEFYKEPDELIIYDHRGNELHRTGMRATTEEIKETISIKGVEKLVFKVNNKQPDSKWRFSVRIE